MTLVAGVDSSTQSCKLEVRDADTGELVRGGHWPHPPTVPPRLAMAPARSRIIEPQKNALVQSRSSQGDELA